MASIVSAAAWFAVFWPLTLIPVLIGMIVVVAKRWDGWGDSIKGLWAITKSFISSAGIGFKDFFQEVIYYGELFWLKIKNVFQYVGGVIANIAAAMKLAMSGDFGGAKKALTMEIKTNASGEIAKLQGDRAQQRRDNIMALDANRKAAAASWGQVGLVRSKTATKTPARYLSEKMDLTGKAGGAPAGVADSAKGISGGGVRNLTISIAKQGIDQITIHAATVKEGKEEIQHMFLEMFSQIINSGNAVTGSGY